MGSQEHQAHKGAHDKAEGQKPNDKAEGLKSPSADDLYKDFQKMIQESAKDSHSQGHIKDDQLVVDPPRYPGDAGTHSQGFIPPAEDGMDKVNTDTGGFIPKYVEDEIKKRRSGEHGGFIPPYLQDEMKMRSEHPQAVQDLETLTALEQMKWGRGAPDIDLTIYQGDPAQLMDKINSSTLDTNGVKNDLMKCMMTEAVCGNSQDGMNKIADLAKQFGLSEQQILEMAKNVRDELKKMGVSTNMSVLNTYIGQHGGAQERSF